MNHILNFLLWTLTISTCITLTFFIFLTSASSFDFSGSFQEFSIWFPISMIAILSASFYNVAIYMSSKIIFPLRLWTFYILGVTLATIFFIAVAFLIYGHYPFGYSLLGLAFFIPFVAGVLGLFLSRGRISVLG